MTNFETCFVCGSPMHLVRERTEMRLGARSATIEVERLKCDACAEVFYTPEQMDAAQRALASELRDQEGLLRPEQIRAIRGRYDLTQAQLERLLGVGPKTVVRWERGTVFQGQTADHLLRTIEAVPAAYEFLARKNGIDTARAAVEASKAGERPEPTVRFAVPGFKKPAKGSRASITDFAEFCRSNPSYARKVDPDAEGGLPTIPKEALK